ncbi:threonylcarbamoyl-AMP synthase [Moraxella caviae]|uniref:Threonylcarbamoyl-AMP synthase n=1 Tax=Moraxella caviae TaxID=34060 RepID=A0A1S9ZXV9_9GAMM|nr:L-threonylcarbamoyladenylate synthase [Moraxella caviae]OOR88300.1 threonylcarbamoyl-AMP synthase [Moraxella caviae]STZ13880.1 Putative translation factor (SUA5) [Moraxella caviae]VEW11162.1 Putative translation factor (SUA5) [Moraxella caviae]
MNILYTHPENPQPRLIDQAVRALQNDELIVYPNDLSYAFGLAIDAKNALEQLKRLRALDDKHQFTLLCRDLSEIATFAAVDNAQYRELKAHTPAAITFILNATKDTPKKLAHPKKKTIGVRVCDTPIVRALLDGLNAPLLTSSLVLAGDELPLDDPYDIEERLGSQVGVFIHTGVMSTHSTSVVDLTSVPATLIRQGVADVSALVR